MTPKLNSIFNLLLGYAFVFFGGFVTAANMSFLLDRNESYEASWFKVVVAVVLAIVGIFMTMNPHFDSHDPNAPEQ